MPTKHFIALRAGVRRPGRAGSREAECRACHHHPLVGEIGGVNNKRSLSSVGLAICSMARLADPLPSLAPRSYLFLRSCLFTMNAEKLVMVQMNSAVLPESCG